MKAIIPCCGQGKRMGMQSNQSKEMLLGPSGYPLILYSVESCWHENIEPLILVRKEKTDLIEWCKENKVEYVIQDPGKEWAETVYNSKDHWSDLNVLILPDTRWQPTSILKDIKRSLEFGSEVVFAIHEVENIRNWGFVGPDTFCEKSKTLRNNTKTAWGLIGFTRLAGIYLFQSMQTQNYFYKHSPKANFLFLDEFKDLTRGEK